MADTKRPCFVIMRRPCLMEDEGRHVFVMAVSTQQEAEQWIAAQAGEYFKPDDYYIVGSTEGAGRRRGREYRRGTRRNYQRVAGGARSSRTGGQPMSDKTQATARPWAIDSDLPPNPRSVLFRSTGDAFIAISGNTVGPHVESDRANAELIVRAVNSHEKLLVAATKAEAELDAMAKVFEHDWKVDKAIYAENARAVIEQLRAAIAEAEVENHEV